jgi:hypothetical protein
MGEVTRRHRADLNPHSGSNSPPPLVERRGEGITVRTVTSQGVQPSIDIAWEIDSSYRGYKLLGFRSTSGFSSSTQPKDLAQHGQKILEEDADGSRLEQLAEGTYFYTLMLFSDGLVFNSVCKPVRFSETIHSAKTVIGRVEDELRLRQLEDEIKMREDMSELARNELVMKLHRSRKAIEELTKPKIETDPLEAAIRAKIDPKLREAFARARSRVEMNFEREKLKEKVKRYPGWKKLPRELQDKIMKDIDDDLDPDEMSWT